jgi:hypothetical protein
MLLTDIVHEKYDKNMVKRGLLKAVVVYFISILFSVIFFSKWFEGWLGILKLQSHPYITFALFTTIIFIIGYSFACFDKSALTKKTLNTICNLKNKGVDLRIKGCNLNSEKDVTQWIREANKWETKMVKATKKLSLKLSNRIKLLGDIRTFPYPVNKVSEEHILRLSFLHERLERLEEYLDNIET